jgi:hypothetical protein
MSPIRILLFVLTAQAFWAVSESKPVRIAVGRGQPVFIAHPIVPTPTPIGYGANPEQCAFIWHTEPLWYARLWCPQP